MGLVRLICIALLLVLLLDALLLLLLLLILTGITFAAVN